MDLQHQQKMPTFPCERFQLALLPSVYGFVFVVALVGNLLALWLLAARAKRNWHTGVILSCNLAVSDLLYVLTLPLLIAYYLSGKDWRFGASLCKVERFLFRCNLYVSVFFVMAISVNRCVALRWPFFARSRVKPAQVKVISVIIWVIVGAISCPVLKFSSLCADGNRTLCVSFCGGQRGRGEETLHFVYNISLGVFGCFVPFLVTFASYCVVIRVVWRNASVTEPEKRKVVLLAVSVLVLYVISFLPYNILLIAHSRQKMRRGKECGVFDMYQLSKGLASLNMCIHPVLYMTVIDRMSLCCRRSPEDKRGKVDMQELNDNQ